MFNVCGMETWANFLRPQRNLGEGGHEWGKAGLRGPAGVGQDHTQGNLIPGDWCSEQEPEVGIEQGPGMGNTETSHLGISRAGAGIGLLEKR